MDTSQEESGVSVSGESYASGSVNGDAFSFASHEELPHEVECVCREGWQEGGAAGERTRV